MKPIEKGRLRLGAVSLLSVILSVFVLYTSATGPLKASSKGRCSWGC